jgi:hypothetical protein
MNKLWKLLLGVLVIAAMIFACSGGSLLVWCESLDEDPFLSMHSLEDKDQLYRFLFRQFEHAAPDEIIHSLEAEGVECGDISVPTQFFREQHQDTEFDHQISCSIQLTNARFESGGEAGFIASCLDMYLTKPVLTMTFLINENSFQDVIIDVRRDFL